MILLRVEPGRVGACVMVERTSRNRELQSQPLRMWVQRAGRELG